MQNNNLLANNLFCVSIRSHIERVFLLAYILYPVLWRQYEYLYGRKYNQASSVIGGLCLKLKYLRHDDVSAFLAYVLNLLVHCHVLIQEGCMNNQGEIIQPETNRIATSTVQTIKVFDVDAMDKRKESTTSRSNIGQNMTLFLSYLESSNGGLKLVLVYKKMLTHLMIIDKASGDVRYSLFCTLYQLLEGETAKHFVAEGLEMPTDCSYVNWIATANEQKFIPDPIQSHFTVFYVDTPTDKQMKKVVRSIYKDIRGMMGLKIGLP